MANTLHSRILSNIESCLIMKHMKCDNPACGYEGGVAVERVPTGKPRICPTCQVGICHAIDNEELEGE
jgi:hypothetical protein